MNRGRFYTCVFVCFLLLMLPVYGKKMTVSVVIPCVPKHAVHLYGLLEEYTRQTVLPEEVVIAFSESEQIPMELLWELRNEQWPFKLVMVERPHKMFPGANRNHAVQHAEGDIIMCQDADDIPHPQRIEIVKYFFETKDIVFLLDLWMPQEYGSGVPAKFGTYVKERVMWRPYIGEDCSVGNGVPSVLRTVCLQVAWPEDIFIGEDMKFNEWIRNMFRGKAVVLNAYLYMYRNQLSSYKP